MRSDLEVQKKINWLTNLKLFDLRSESEIKKYWEEDPDRPVVSIICNTYMHHLYIEHALKGFLIQETDFPFEIIVHDDASTDSTANIIKEYQKKFPSIIKSIFQRENQYSKGRKPTFLSFPHCKGKYIAFCEGDDFWFNPSKLGQQKRLLDIYPNVDLCTHPTVVTNNEGSVRSLMLEDIHCEVIEASDVITGGGSWCATSSIFVRRDIIQEFIRNFEDAPVGDLFIQCMGAARGGCVFSPMISSVYRTGVPGNWSGKRGSPNRLEVFNEKMQNSLSRLAQLDHFSNYESEIDTLRSKASYSTSADYFRVKDIERSYFYIKESISYKPALHHRQILLFLLLVPMRLTCVLRRFFRNLF